MIGLILIAHQPLASALVASAKHVYDCAPTMATERVAVLDVMPDANLEVVTRYARALVAAVDRGDGVIVLTDTFGATPGNVATALAEPGRVAVVAGVNLPMLLRTLCYRESTLAAIVDKAIAGGTQGVMQITGTPTPIQQDPIRQNPVDRDDSA